MRSVLVVLTLCLPGLVFAATPSEGVELKVRRGFFTETDIGAFLTVGGDNDYSNAQTYLQLGLGYDVSEQIELGASFGLGSNAANCFSGLNKVGDCTLSENFTVTFLDVTAAYLFRLGERFYLAPKLAGGYTLLDPPPVPDVSSGINIGAGVGVEYATSLDHFSIGADALVRFIIGPNIPTIAIFPRVKYTF